MRKRTQINQKALKAFRACPSQWIEEHTSSCDFGYRGGEIRVCVDEIFVTASNPVMGAWQNYLGGGIAGRIVGAAMFMPDELHESLQPIFHEVKDAIVAYAYDLNNGGGDEYMQEEVNSFEFNQTLPVSGY